MQFTRAIMAAFFFVAVVLYVGFSVLLLRSSRRRPGKGRVLVVRSPHGTRVHRNATLVLPFVHSAVEFETGDKRIEVDVTDPPLTWADGVTTPGRAVVTIGVPDDDERILELDQGIGCERGSDEVLLSALYRETFARVIRDVASTQSRPTGTRAEALEAEVRERLDGVIGPFEVRRVTLDWNEDPLASRGGSRGQGETSP